MKIIPALVCLATVLAPTCRGEGCRLSRIGDGYSATSVNTAIFRTNSITSRDSVQYAAYYDPDGYVTLASRTLGTDDWTVVRTQYRGNVADAHNVISIAVDGSGILHASFDHHGHPLRYARGTAPGALTLGPLEQMVGRDEDDVTYPEFHTLPSGDLIFVYRSGASGRGNMVMNRYNLAERRWERVHDVLIDGEGQRNAYWQLYADPAGTLHLSWVWRETWLVETNHDLCYARSTDGGRTWQRSDGSAYTLPVTAATAEVAWHVPQKSELINQTSMTADDAGRPLIATYWRDSTDTVPRYRLVRHDGHRWQMETVGERHTPFSLSGGGTKMIPVSRPRVVSDGRRIVYLFRDAERGSRVSAAVRPAAGGAWEVTDLTDFSVDAWEPTIDTELWRTGHRLHIYVQRTSQGDGERTTDTPPQPVYVLEAAL